VLLRCIPLFYVVVGHVWTFCVKHLGNHFLPLAGYYATPLYVPFDFGLCQLAGLHYSSFRHI
jgi:hypothetical protein